MNRFLFIFSLIILAALSRLLPHPPNFTPVGAIALFAGNTLPRRWSYFIPLIVMLVSDFFIGYHYLMIPVYLALMVNVFIGENIKRSHILFGSFVGSLFFFVLTNFAVWLMYDIRSVSTMIECYVLAIPFYKYSLAGDLIFTTVIFGILAFSENRFPVLRPKLVRG